MYVDGHKAASSRTSEAALWPSTYISPLSNSTPCIRKDRISSKSLMRLSICLWKPSRSEERFSRNAETDLVCRLLLEKKNKYRRRAAGRHELDTEVGGVRQRSV